MHFHVSQTLSKALSEARWHFLVSFTFLTITSCSVKQSPTQEESVEVAAEWSAEGLDVGLVDNGWIETFNDSKFHKNNRVLTDVDAWKNRLILWS